MMPVSAVGTPTSGRSTWVPPNYPDWKAWDKLPKALSPQERSFPKPTDAPVQHATDPEGRPLASRFIAGGQDHNTPLHMQQIKELASLLTKGDIKWSSRADTTSSETKYSYDNASSTVQPRIIFNNRDINPMNLALPHETGHVIDGTLAFLSDRLDSALLKDPVLNQELHRMHFDYEHPPSTNEALADALARYMVDPQGTKRDFPHAAKWLRDHINTDAMINRVLTLSQNDQGQAAVG